LHPVNRLIEKKILASINRLVHLLIEMSYISEERKEPYIQEAINLISEIRPYLLSLIEGKDVLLESLLRQLISQKLPHPSVLRSFGNLQRDLNTIIHIALHSDSVEEVEEEKKEEPENKGLESEDEISEDLPDAETVNEIDGDEDEKLPAAPEEVDETGKEPPAEPPAEESIEIEEPAGTPVDEFLKMPEPEEPPDLLQNIITSIYADEEIIKDYIFRSLPIDYYLPARKTGIITGRRRKTALYDLLLKKEGVRVIEITPEECCSVHLLSRKLPRFS